VAGLVDHELKLAVRMFTVEHPFPLYRSFNNPFNDKVSTPVPFYPLLSPPSPPSSIPPPSPPTLSHASFSGP
jgi:hypothetical protein